MGMKLFPNLHFRTQQTHERNELVDSSLVASSLLHSHLIAWSGSTSRDRLLAMRFHKEWHHKDCPVIKWYQGQSGTSTTFQSVEHRQILHAPYFHEYLLLKLTDGAVCRVERVGDGSRANALRYVGCASYDLIQWFPRSEYDEATKGSALIAEINFGQDFDLIDVLAVCYAIQETKPCNVYTLQRYNCYFLCLAILAVFHRRVANWETKMTAEVWDSCVTSILDELSSLSSEEAKKHTLLQLCAALDPGNRQAADCVFKALRQHLISNPECLAAYNKSISDVLWYTSWESALFESLRDVLKLATATLLEDESYCINRLKEAITMEQDDVIRSLTKDEQLEKTLCDVARRSITASLGPYLLEYQSVMRMKQIERPMPLHVWALSFIGGAAAALLYVCTPSSLKLKLLYGVEDRLLAVSLTGLPFTFVSGGVSSLICTSLTGIEEEEPFEFGRSAAADRHFTPIFMSMTMNELVVNTQGLFAFLSWFLDSSDEVVTLKGLLVVPSLAYRLMLLDKDGEPRSTTRVLSESMGNQDFGSAEFQEQYIKKRINAHAERVEQYHLAAAPLVCRDIETTIEKVWKSLPAGFRGVKTQSK